MRRGKDKASEGLCLSLYISPFRYFPLVPIPLLLQNTMPIAVFLCAVPNTKLADFDTCVDAERVHKHDVDTPNTTNSDFDTPRVIPGCRESTAVEDWRESLLQVAAER